MTTEFGAGSSVSSFGTRRPKNHVVRVEEYRFALTFNRCFRGPSVSHVQSCSFFVSCWNRDPRSSFIHFITTAVSIREVPVQRISIIPFTLCPPCKQEKSPKPSKHAPPFRPKKTKKTHPSFNSPKIPITSLGTTHRTSISDRPPDELHIPPDIEPKSETRRHRFTARPHRAKLSRVILHLPFTSVIAFKIDACLESLHGGHLPFRHNTYQSPPPASALTVSAHVSRPA